MHVHRGNRIHKGALTLCISCGKTTEQNNLTGVTSFTLMAFTSTQCWPHTVLKWCSIKGAICAPETIRGLLIQKSRFSAKRLLGCRRKGRGPGCSSADVKRRNQDAEIKPDEGNVFTSEAKGRVKSWEGAFYFLSNKSAEGIARSQREWAHGLQSVVWMDVSYFVHMAVSRRTKKVLL